VRQPAASKDEEYNARLGALVRRFYRKGLITTAYWVPIGNGDGGCAVVVTRRPRRGKPARAGRRGRVADRTSVQKVEIAASDAELLAVQTSGCENGRKRT
jgi:hypothetical protein